MARINPSKLTLMNYTPNRLEHCDGLWKLPPGSLIAKVEPADNVPPLLHLSGVPVLGRGHTLTTYLYNRMDKTTAPFPDPVPGVILVVSSRVRLVNPTRYDLWNPSGYERDAYGNVLSFRFFEAWGEPDWD